MRPFLLALVMTSAAGSFAYSADLGQYRPGTPYQSVVAVSADVCENHCAGDAQCRSWNYVKVNPKAAGVCEFNSNIVPPVASAISISGTNLTTPQRAGVISGTTNTIRVGTNNARQVQSRVQPSTTTRRIVREPIPEKINPHTASTRRVIKRPELPTQAPIQAQNPQSLTAQQNQYRQRQVQPQLPVQMQQQARSHTQPQRPVYPNMPQTARSAVPQTFKYDLGDQVAIPPQNMPNRPQMPQTQPFQQPPFAQRAIPPNYGAQRTHSGGNNSVTARDRRRQQGPTRRAALTPPTQQAVPPQYMGQMAPPQSPQIQSPQLRTPASAPVQPAMARRPANQPLTYRDAPAQQSLYGKLNDDIIQPNAGAPIPADVNAPIPTSMSRPVEPVTQTSLGELAGAPRP